MQQWDKADVLRLTFSPSALAGDLRSQMCEGETNLWRLRPGQCSSSVCLMTVFAAAGIQGALNLREGFTKMPSICTYCLQDG
eukprot:scaffold271496_cov18-Tisochrysis_lutea.AAC.2